MKNYDRKGVFSIDINRNILKILMIMKLTTFFFLISIMSVTARGYSQHARLNLSLQNASIHELFQEIEKQSEFNFFYKDDQIDVNKVVSIEADNSLIGEILNQVFENTDVSYTVVNKVIVITPRKVQQNFQVTGTVSFASTGETLPGVTILVKGTETGTITGMDGKYSIEVPDANSVLVFSYVGYTTQEISVNGRSVVDVFLEESFEVLDEVVVIGYGTQKKVNLTGAVGVAKGEVLENRPIANVGEGLQGIIPNLNVTIRNGDPTSRVDFNIRGYESITGGAPLVLIDGVPMDMNKLNPNDIKSISVLKDAAASAIYGARAAYGVILVETKKGETGKIKVQFNTQWSMAKPIFNMDPITDPYEYVLATNQANQRTYSTDYYDADYVAGTKAWSENPNTAPEWAVVNGELRFYGYNDYQNQIMIDYAPTQQHNLSISGGTENASYYASFGYFSKDGYLSANNEKFKRYNAVMKGDFKITDWLSADTKIIFSSQNSDKPHFYRSSANINTLARVNPILPIQFPDLEYYITPGDREDYEQYIGMYFEDVNFWPYLMHGGRTIFNNNDTWLSGGMTLTPIKGLKIRSDISYNLYHYNYQDVQSKVDIVSYDLLIANPIGHGFSGDDWINNRSNYNQYYVFNTYAEYTLDKSTNHHLTALLGFNQELGQHRYIGAKASSLITPQITELNATVGNQQTSGGSSHVALRGLFYRVNYIFKDRYLVEVNGRYDGTSRFPSDDRFGFFPSFSAGWRISNENFMDGAKSWMDNLKIRASYGTLGNQLLGSNYYPYISTMGIGMSNYMMSSSGLIPYVSAAGLVSPTLTWEKVVTKNLGLDFTLLQSRLDASFDIYTRETKDMLMSVEYPSILGTSAPKQNAADLKTSGWEIALTWRDRISQDWNYNFSLALADWTSEITKYDNPSGALSEYYVGQKLGEIWGFETVGIFQYEDNITAAADQSRIGANWRPGDIQYADLNNDGEISQGSNTLDDPGDRKIIGNNTPRGSFGINGGVGYKSFRLSVFFQGVMQRDHWPTSGNWTWFFPFNSSHVEKYFITESWSEDNRDAYFAAPHMSSNNKKNLQTQSRFLQQAGYIRLKNVTFSYDFPQSLVSKIGVSNAQLYVTGMNLWEYSKIHKPLDPETIYQGAVDYPMQRIFTLGARLSF